VIYVASPHAFHADHSRMAMAAGRHVLCEKPLSLSEKQAARMIDTARSHDVFLMEALWTRFLPVMADVRERIADGAIGDPVYARAVFAETGVDAQCSGVMDFQGGAQATWTASTRADAGRTAAIAGPEGRLEGQRSWWKGGDWIYTSADGETERLSRPFEGNGYQFEAAHVMECLREDRRESPEWPHSASRDLLRLMDAHRERWGVRYPQEASP
jgi:predicted dehydrogenase